MADEKENLNNIIESLDCNFTGKAKLSRNFLKKSDNNDDKFVNMVTYRSNKTDMLTFEGEVESIKDVLIQNNFNFEKVEIEYCIYDTNTEHDNNWINE